MKKFKTIILLATSLSYVIVILDTSIVNVAISSISKSLQNDLSGLQWVVNAYTLTFASVLLTGGALGDRWGFKNVYILGLLTFCVASILCATAPNLFILIAARIIQGIGAALLVPSSLALININFEEGSERASAIGLWAGFGGIAMAAGPLIGGILIHYFDWRSIFWINVPITIIALGLSLRIPSNETSKIRLQWDFIGQLSAICAMVALIYTLIKMPHLDEDKTSIIFSIFIFIVSCIILYKTEVSKRYNNPFLQFSFFENFHFNICILATMVSAFIFYGAFFLISYYVQTYQFFSPLKTGLVFLPLTTMVAIGSFSSKAFANKVGRRNHLFIAFLIYALGFLGLWTLTLPNYLFFTMLFFIPLGYASGIVTPIATQELFSTVGRTESGTASGILNASRQLGSAIGVAFFGMMLAVLINVQTAILISVTVAVLSCLITAIYWKLAPEN